MDTTSGEHTARKNAGLRSLVVDEPLLLFFGLAFLISWGCRVPAIFIPTWPGVISFLSMLGPAFAAVATLLICGDRVGIAEMMRSLFRWRVGWYWYLAALLVPPALMGVTYAVNQSFWPDERFALPPVEAFAPAFVLVLLNFLYLLFLEWGEEIGWRGYALPRLQARMHPLAASAVLGLLWGIWHLPNFWIAGSMQQMVPVPIYLLYLLGHAYLYSWIYNGAKGSLLLCCIHHAATNAFLAGLVILPGFGGVIQRPALLVVISFAAAAVVILATRGNLLAMPRPDGEKAALPPGY